METRERTISDPLEQLKEWAAQKELAVTTGYTLADAIREGSQVTTKLEGGYLEDDKACSLSAAALAAKARGYINF